MFEKHCYRAIHSGLNVSSGQPSDWWVSFRTQRSGVRNLGRPILAKGVGLRFFGVPIPSGLLRMTVHMFRLTVQGSVNGL